VIKDLSKHYDTAIAALESIVGWRMKRRIKGKLVLGDNNSIDAGLRNQRRSAPLETVTVDLPGGRKLRLATVGCWRSACWSSRPKRADRGLVPGSQVF
jgi:hypothetical protein